MARRYYYTLETDSGKPIYIRGQNGYYSINTARSAALEYVKRTEYTDQVVILRNLVNYMLIMDNGDAVYMDGDYIKKNSPVMVLNPDGSIKMSSKTRKKTARKK